MQLIHDLANVDLYYYISLYAFLFGLAALLFFIFLFVSSKLKNNKKQFLVITFSLFIFSLITFCYCQIQNAILIEENREQIVQTFNSEGYEVMDPSEIKFTDHSLHEVSIIKDNKDITKMAYRIGRCDCYFYIYEISGESYVNITPEEDL